MVGERAETLRSHRLLSRVWEAMGRPAGVVTGGFVRDTLLGRTTTDLDFALAGDLDSVAESARRLADAHATRPHLLGRKPRAVWRVEAANLKIEIWPLGPLTVEDDILRRDFTCNALAWRLPDGPLIDLVGGLEHLEAGRLAAVSRGNLQDDPLRLLRAARFLAQLESFELDHRTAGLIRELAPALAYAPRARVGQELALLLSAAGADRGIRAMLDLGIFRFSAPVDSAPDPTLMDRHAAAMGRLARPARHPVPAAVRAAGWVASLALLVRSWGCPVDSSLADYSWPKADRVAALRSAALLERAAAAVRGESPERRELIHLAGTAFPVLLAAAAAAGSPAGDDQPAGLGWRRWWAQWQRVGALLVAPPPLLSSEEVGELARVAPGPELGALLRRLRMAQVRGDIRSATGARRWIEAHSPARPVER